MGTAIAGGNEAERLNRGCFCITLDRYALMETLNRDVGSQDFAQTLAETHPSLFSNVLAFVPAETLTEMARVIDAVEAAARLPSYREAALSWALPIARLDFGPIGALCVPKTLSVLIGGGNHLTSAHNDRRG
jgi:hypothetical protein